MQSRTDAQNATATEVRSGATLLKNFKVEQRTTDAPRLFLQIFNIASPTVGTDAPEVVIPVPAGSGNFDSARLGGQFQGNGGGLYLSTALSYAVTTTHDGNTAPDAGDEPVVILDYEQLGA